jgi:hypothetical protein
MATDKPGLPDPEDLMPPRFRHFYEWDKAELQLCNPLAVQMI